MLFFFFVETKGSLETPLRTSPVENPQAGTVSRHLKWRVFSASSCNIYAVRVDFSWASLMILDHIFIAIKSYDKYGKRADADEETHCSYTSCLGRYLYWSCDVGMTGLVWPRLIRCSLCENTKFFFLSSLL